MNVKYFIFETNVVIAVNHHWYLSFVLDDIRKIVGFEKLPEKAFASQGWKDHFAKITIENETFTIITSNAVFHLLSFFRRKKVQTFKKWLEEEVIEWFVEKKNETLFKRSSVDKLCLLGG
jgi:prophage antirepressor-like protein